MKICGLYKTHKETHGRLKITFPWERQESFYPPAIG